MTKNIAIVTGASRGIGPHIARALADAGYTVVLAARTEALVTERAAEINAAGGSAIALAADITNEADRALLVGAASAAGRVAVLVNNAALGPISNFHEHSTSDLTNIVDVNLTAPMELSRLVVAHLLKSGVDGRIVNVATVAAKIPLPNMVLYSATKAALTQFSAALDLEYRDRGIRATTVLPGAVSEEGMAIRAVEETGVDIPNDGAVHPSVVANAVVAAIRDGKAEVYVGSGSRFMARHPRLAYRLMRRGGVLTALGQAADRYPHRNQAAA